MSSVVLGRYKLHRTYWIKSSSAVEGHVLLLNAQEFIQHMAYFPKWFSLRRQQISFICMCRTSFIIIFTSVLCEQLCTLLLLLHNFTKANKTFKVPLKTSCMRPIPTVQKNAISFPITQQHHSKTSNSTVLSESVRTLTSTNSSTITIPAVYTGQSQACTKSHMWKSFVK